MATASQACVLPAASVASGARCEARSLAASTHVAVGCLQSKAPNTVLLSSFRPSQIQFLSRKQAGGRCSSSSLVQVAAVFILEPVGDGDSSHLDEDVVSPGVIKLEGEAVILGRAADRSDVVVSVPTVSGSHARIEVGKDGVVVTDLNSTNGTFVNDQRLRPGAPTAVPVGTIVTFGDQHLAAFKVAIDAVDV